MTVDVEELLKQILQNQKRLLESIEKERQTTRNIEERLSKIEQARTGAPTEVEIPPSLVRVLKGLVEAGKPLSAEDVAKKINLSRNLTSGYLNKLAEMGYTLKEPNLESGGPRYLFRANISALPNSIKKIITRYGR